jgi:hypothetical protein
MTIDDMVSNRSEYMGGNNDDDMVVVAMHNPIFEGGYRNNVPGSTGMGKRLTKIELKRRDEDDDITL